MTKALFLSAVALCGMTASAQQLQRNASAPVALAQMAPATVQNDAEEVRWGYPQAGLINYGLNYQPETVGIAMKMDGSKLTGAKISGMSVVLPYIPNLSDIKVWVGTHLPWTFGDDGDVLTYAPDPSTLTGEQFSDIYFPEPVDITGSELYLGVYFTQNQLTEPNDYFPLWAYDLTRCVEGGFYMQSSVTFGWMWYDLTMWGYGHAAMDALLDVSGLNAPVALTAAEVGTHIVKLGDVATLDCQLKNPGSVIKNVDITLDVDGVMTTQTYTLSKPLSRINEIGTTTLTLDLGNEAKAVEVAYSIDKVNGIDNAEQVGNSGEGEFIAVSELAERKTVYESFTTIETEIEVLAWASAPLLKEAVGDKMIAINAHFSTRDDQAEPFECLDYSDVALAMTNGYLPYYILDRKTAFNPYYGHTDADAQGTYHFAADQVFNEVNAQASEASIELVATWADEECQSIQATAITTFGYSREESIYGICFVVKEDGVSYEGSTMENALSPEYNDGYYEPRNDLKFPDADIQWAINLGAVIEAPVYDDVVRAAWGCQTGVENSVQSPIVCAEAQEFSMVLDLTQAEILNAQNVKVVALLINLNDGTLVNAAEVVPGVVTAIPAISTNEQQMQQVYGIDGSRRNGLSRGLNVIRFSNGSSVKVIK